jgi:thiol-disulfide isomerase/thioredoxin
MPASRRDLLILGAVGLAAAAAGALVGPMLVQSRSGAADLLAARFPDLAGRPRRLLEWQGRVLVCNFWATWCAPCREEIPLFVSLREKFVAKGVEIVGIGIDNAAKISEFVKIYKVSYPILVAGAEALELMRKLGNTSGGLPFTVFLDRQGRLVHRKLGPIKAPELEEKLAGLLAI